MCIEGIKVPTPKDKNKNYLEGRIRVKHFVTADKLLEGMERDVSNRKDTYSVIAVTRSPLQATTSIKVGWLCYINPEFNNAADYQQDVVAELKARGVEMEVMALNEPIEEYVGDNRSNRIHATHLHVKPEDINRAREEIAKLYNPHQEHIRFPGATVSIFVPDITADGVDPQAQGLDIHRKMVVKQKLFCDNTIAIECSSFADIKHTRIGGDGSNAQEALQGIENPNLQGSPLFKQVCYFATDRKKVNLVVHRNHIQVGRSTAAALVFAFELVFKVWAHGTLVVYGGRHREGQTILQAKA